MHSKQKAYPTGFLFKEEFAKLYSQLFPHKDCTAFLDKLFLAFDSDKSGFVSFTELMIAISLSSNDDATKKLKLVFNIYDKNNSKSLELGEVNAILTGLKNTMIHDSEMDEVNEIMKWDKDINGSLNEQEFIDLIMSKPTLKKYFIDLIKVHD